MDLQRSIVDDDTGVSPVIGVILMVAVTVMIAAVIGSTALGLADSVSETPPQAQFDMEQDDSYEMTDMDDNTDTWKLVTLRHSGGEDVNMRDVKVTVDGDPAYEVIDDPNVYNDATTLEEQSIYSGTNTRSNPILTVPGWDTETASAGDEFPIVSAHTKLVERDMSPTPPGVDQNIVYYNTDPSTYELSVGGDRIKDDDVLLQSGQTLRLIWESGDQSQTLLEEEIE